MKEKFNIWNWYKSLSKGWQVITFFIGFTMLVSGATLVIDHFRTKVVNANLVIKYLSKSDSARIKNEKIKDSIDRAKWENLYKRIDNISDSLIKNYNKTAKLTDSYATFVQKHISVVPEALQLLNGLEFTIVQPVNINKSMEDRSDLRIKIIRKQTNDTIK
jgi:histidyl-tRNA synthetase